MSLPSTELWFFQAVFQVIHIVVAVAYGFALSDSAPFINTGVVFPVGKSDIFSAQKTGNGSLIGLVTGRHDDRVFPLQEVRNVVFQFFMQTQSSIEEPAAGTSGAEFFQSLFACLDDPGVVGQVQVIVGRYRDNVASTNGDMGTVHRFNFAEIRINTEVFGLVRGFIPVAF